MLMGGRGGVGRTLGVEVGLLGDLCMEKMGVKDEDS